MTFNLQRIRYERLSRKVSQDKMAAALKIHRSSYHKKENGLIKMSVEEFGVILDTLGIPKNDAGKFFVKDVPEWEQISQ